MDPLDNQELAKHLAGPPKGPPEEACRRGACGRTYYAAFCYARDTLESADIPISGGTDAHRDVVDRLKSSGDSTIQAAGGELDTLRKNRNRADYDVGIRVRPYTVRDTGFDLARGSTIIRAIKNKKKTHRRLEIP